VVVEEVVATHLRLMQLCMVVSAPSPGVVGVVGLELQLWRV
jgi:hypothetical protein